MKRFLSVVLFVALGSGLWWLLSSTHQKSVKKWDAKFDTVLRHHLTDLGFNNNDVLARVNVLRTDKAGEWVVTQLTLKKPSTEKIQALKTELEESGADVEEDTLDGAPALVVKRGKRVYQEIRFEK